VSRYRFNAKQRLALLKAADTIELWPERHEFWTGVGLLDDDDLPTCGCAGVWIAKWLGLEHRSCDTVFFMDAVEALGFTAQEFHERVYGKEFLRNYKKVPRNLRILAQERVS